MNKGAQFVMDKSVQPVIDYYEKIIKPQKGVISDEKFKDIQKMYKTSIGAKSVLSSLIEIGDVYKYIKYIVKNNNKESRDRFINYNLTPFEKYLGSDSYFFSTEFSLYDGGPVVKTDCYYENGIEYHVSKNNESGGTKVYYDYRTPGTYYIYEYLPENGFWTRKKKSGNRDYYASNGVDLWDINNYVYNNGIYDLKDYIDAGTIKYVTIWNYEDRVHYKEYRYITLFEKTYVSLTFKRYSRFGEKFDLKLPTEYQEQK